MEYLLRQAMVVRGTGSDADKEAETGRGEDGLVTPENLRRC